MATVSPRGRSPHSPYDFDSADDSNESWQLIDYSSGASTTASVGFLPSPASGSMSGFAMVGHVSTPSPRAGTVSPLPLGDVDQAVFFPSATSHPAQPEPIGADAFAMEGFGAQEPFMMPQDFLLTQPEAPGLSQQDLNDMGPFLNDFDTNLSPLRGPDQGLQQVDFGGWISTQLNPDVPPWNPEVLEDYDVGDDTLKDPSVSPSIDGKSTHSASSRSASAKSDTSSVTKSPRNIRKVKASKVEKKKNKKGEEPDKFVIVTPISIASSAGKPNPWECFEAEAARATQRGRKGPLADATKESALVVRRLGACFCCHSRKVKCDKERPCRHCRKLMAQVPQVVCWQFQDFLTVLFPDFIRGHFRRDDMSRFIRDNVQGFTVGGVDLPCDVELFSGARFGATLNVKAKFFTAKTGEVLQHWHLTTSHDRSDLQSSGTAPIGLDLSSSAQKDYLKKRTKAYIEEVIKEPAYAEQVTETFRSTQLPTKVLRIVQTFAKQSDSTMAKRALSIYAMHYVMTRHLCLTQQTIISLQPSGLVPHTPWVTARVLARQIKSVVDELIMREMQQLFDMFSKSLKPRERREWAPCLAAFLVLCLYMEAVETTTDNFVLAQNEVNMREQCAPEIPRSFALDMCREVENMPFKQFAYQFHSIYQTHTKDANTKAFNPLLDDSFAELGELDGPAVQLVQSLRELFCGEDWQDMQFLADDDLLLGRDQNPFPMDTSFFYTGRLVAKFLLSFMDEHAIFGSQI